MLNGVKQGCVLSPLLFNITLDYVMSKVSKNSVDIRWGLCGKLTDLDYADDIRLLAHSTREKQKMLERIEREAAQMGLKIYVNKSKEMGIATNNNETLTIHSETTERVSLLIWGALLTTQVVRRQIPRPVDERPRQHSAHSIRSGTQRHIQCKQNFASSIPT